MSEDLHKINDQITTDPIRVIDSDGVMQRLSNHGKSPIASEVLEHVDIKNVLCFGNAKKDLIDTLGAWGGKFFNHFCGFNHK